MTYGLHFGGLSKAFLYDFYKRGKVSYVGKFRWNKQKLAVIILKARKKIRKR